jgi:hypothetical protein
MGCLLLLSRIFRHSRSFAAFSASHRDERKIYLLPHAAAIDRVDSAFRTPLKIQKAQPDQCCDK